MIQYKTMVKMIQYTIIVKMIQINNIIHNNSEDENVA